MRDHAMLGATAATLLVAALYTVGLRTEIYVLGRDSGRLADRQARMVRRNDNLAIELERARSPRALRELAEGAGIVLEPAAPAERARP
ncbi:MAG: hypothetical protein ACE5JG_07080 [Planctomycetota bacterium]